MVSASNIRLMLLPFYLSIAGVLLLSPDLLTRNNAHEGLSVPGSEESSLVSSEPYGLLFGAFPLAYCNGKVIVCPGVMLMCEMFCPPYTSEPVLVRPVTGMTAVAGLVDVDGIVS